MKGVTDMNTRAFTFCMVLLLCCVVLAPTAYSQMRRMSPEDQVKILKDSLQLNDLQVKKITTILEDSREEMSLIRSEKGDDQEAMRSAMQDLRKKTDAKIIALLTKEQAATYEAMQKARQERMMKGMQDNK